MVHCNDDEVSYKDMSVISHLGGHPSGQPPIGPHLAAGLLVENTSHLVKAIAAMSQSLFQQTPLSRNAFTSTCTISFPIKGTYAVNALSCLGRQSISRQGAYITATRKKHPPLKGS